MVKEKIKNLAPGAFFNAGPAVVTVLEHFADGRTLLAAKKPIGNRPFTVRPFTYDRTEPEPNPNNFAFSSLRYDLNTDFLDALNDAGVIPADKVLEAEWSLADHDGTNRYGVAVCKIAMLPEPLIRKYYDAGLLEIDDWEWTITPYAGNAHYVRSVYSDGDLDSNTPGMAAAAFARLSSWILKSACSWNRTKSNCLTPPCCANLLRNSLSKKFFAGSPPARTTKTNDRVLGLEGQSRRKPGGRPGPRLLR